MEIHMTTHLTTGKTISLTRQTFVSKVISLLFNMLSMLVVAFLSMSRVFSFHGCSHHLQWFWSSPKIKSLTVSPSFCNEVMELDAMIFIFWMLRFRSAFSLSSFTFIKRLFSIFSFSAKRVLSYAYLRLLIFLLASWFQLVLNPAQHFVWCSLHIS